MAFLEVKDITVCYDTATIVDELSFEVNEGELVGLVGPNGAGKTTSLRAISGLIRWDMDITRGMRKELANITFEGSIIFDGEEIKGLPAHEIAEKGVVLCPERAKPFREMTVEENLKAGAYLVKDKRKAESSLERVYALFPRLKERRSQISGTLSGGERQMLAIGRALMPQPKLMLIDEPSLGLAPIVKADLFNRIKEIHGGGLTIALVEQDVSFAFELAKRCYVFSRGHTIAEGTPKKLLADELIRKTYLGL